MSDLVVDPSSLTSAALEIQQCAARLGALKLAAGFRSGYSTATFGQLAGAFKGATTDMTDVAGAADQQIARSLTNTSGTVSAFAELVLGCKNTTVETDQRSATTISNAIGYPARVGPQTDHPVPVYILTDLAGAAPR